MSELLSGLNNPDAAKESASWEAEVASATAEIEAKPEPVIEKPAEAPPAIVTPPVAPEPPLQAEDERKVPLKALHEEREARKALERKLAELEQRFNAPPQQEYEQEQEQEPDPEQDPIGALKYTRQQLAAMQQAQQEQSYETQLATAYQQSAQTFAAETPDFRDAYNYTIQSRAAELRAFGVADHQINETIRREEMQIAANAMQAGRNPAEAIYTMAKARGYAAKPADVPPPAPVIPVIDPKLEKAKADAAVSLSSGGKPPANDLTLEDAVRTLKGAAWESYADKLWKDMEATSGRKTSIFRQ